MKNQQPPLEPLVTTAPVDEGAPSETTQYDAEGTDYPEHYPAEVDDADGFLGDLDKYLYSVGEKRRVMAAEGKVKWRGSNHSSPEVIVCAHMVAKLSALARGTGQGILVRPLSEITGSYQTDTKASAFTHAAGGAIDVDMRRLSRSQARFFEAVGRNVGLLFFWRPAIRGVWTDHGHVLDPACSTMSVQAAAQFPLFERGFNGLEDNPRDTGDRSRVAAIMREFRASRPPRPNPASAIYTVRAGDTLGRIATKFGTTPARLAALNGIADINRIFVGQRLRIR